MRYRQLAVLMAVNVVATAARSEAWADAFTLPGDASFHTMSPLPPSQPGESLVLAAAMPWTPSGVHPVGPHAGAKSLIIESCQPAFCANWNEAIATIRRVQPRVVQIVESKEKAGASGPAAIIERTPIHAWILNSDFDLRRNSPFLRYNENWITECQDVYHIGRDNVSATHYVPDCAGISVRDASHVERLRCRTDDPFSFKIMSSESIVALLVEQRHLKILWDRAAGADFGSADQQSDVRVFAVSAKATKVYSYIDGFVEIVHREGSGWHRVDTGEPLQ